MVKINNRKLAKSAEKAVDKAGTAVKNVPNAQNLTRFIAQGLTYKIQRDLHNARDKIAQEAKDAGSQSEYQTAKILPLVRNISYLLNALSVEQFFQNNNDIPKACAGIQLATMFVGGQMLVSLEDVLASFIHISAHIGIFSSKLPCFRPQMSPYTRVVCTHAPHPGCETSSPYRARQWGWARGYDQ